MFACMLSMGAMAQATKTIKGAVIDKSGNPLPGATVEATGGAESVTTDADGTFTMEVPIWLKSVTAKYPGYKDQIQKVGYADIIFEMGKGSKVYNRLTWGYTPQFLGGEDFKEYKDSKVMHGAAFNWTIGTRLTNKINLYLETGIGVQYNYWKYKYTETYIYINYDYDYRNGTTTKTPYYSTSTYKDDVHNLALYVPVQLAYQLNLGKNIIFQPYLGFHIKANIMTLVDGDYEVGTERGKYAPVQGGMQFGVGFTFKKFYLGAGYSFDFNSYVNKGKTNTSDLNVSLGLQF